MNGLSNQPFTPDLRGFIEYLDKEHPEEIIRVTKEVDLKIRRHRHSSRARKGRAFQGRHIREREGIDIPLVANMHGSFNRLKYAIGMEEGTERIPAGLRSA